MNKIKEELRISAKGIKLDSRFLMLYKALSLLILKYTICLMLHESVCFKCLGCCMCGICVHCLKLTVQNMLPCPPVLDGNGSGGCKGSEQRFWNQPGWVES